VRVYHRKRHALLVAHPVAPARHTLHLSAGVQGLLDIKDMHGPRVLQWGYAYGHRATL